MNIGCLSICYLLEGERSCGFNNKKKSLPVFFSNRLIVGSFLVYLQLALYLGIFYLGKIYKSRKIENK